MNTEANFVDEFDDPSEDLDTGSARLSQWHSSVWQDADSDDDGGTTAVPLYSLRPLSSPLALRLQLATSSVSGLCRSGLWLLT